MTRKEMRVEIAKELGWTIQDTGKGHSWHFNGIMEEGAPPNWPEDLNAIQQAIISKGAAFQPKFADALYKTARINKHLHECTAEEWCVSFLKTINRWKD